ncbi:MAG: outer membrane protein assembly factor BamE [Neisseriaceae bacterium]|nr:outer membrane protein assembly factor BamE [Neisseriaceae bacterium]MBP6861116.1 outer membrane protein assembly factor BamE [Neisseriaceae bacterium]
MKKMNKTLLGLTTVAALLLSACTSVSNVKSNGTTDEVVWPDAESVSFKTGSFPVVNALKLVRPGMTKDQLYNLLGRPHFNEGLVGVVEWDYLFHFPLSNGEVKTCQYKVLFDNDKLAQSFFWREPACAELINGRAVAAAQAEQIELSADALFKFNGSEAHELLPQGQEALNNLARQLNQGYVTINSITLTGHTDRLGSDAYNHRLGLERANTVRSVLQQQGVNAPISTRSAGKGMPKTTDCVGNSSSAALKACLQADRRVTVDVSGVRKK